MPSAASDASGLPQQLPLRFAQDGLVATDGFRVARICDTSLPLRPNADGRPQRFDVLRGQRLAKPATVYVEAFSAHPPESDAAELYGPPDGYLDAKGAFHKERTSSGDKAEYEIEIKPSDGLYPLPYMARQADGSPWEEECTTPGAPPEKARQGLYPDGSAASRRSIAFRSE
jgi:L-asparaginase